MLYLYSGHLRVGLETLRLRCFILNTFNMSSKVESGFVFYNTSKMGKPDYNQNEPSSNIIDKIQGELYVT